ncbi:MAG: HAMP domain-containing protein [Desulfobacterales bacterium]|nr:HAMP domain-containing protein [Desulfobacterales bacterium]
MPFFSFSHKNEWSLKTKFYLISGFLILMVIIMVAFSIYRECCLTREILERGKKELVGVFAVSISDAVMNEKPEMGKKWELLDNYIGRIMANENLNIGYVVVADTSGRIIRDRYNERFEGYREIHLGQTTLQDTLPGNTLIRRYKADQEMLEISTPLIYGSRKVGYLRIGFYLQNLQDNLLKRYLVKPYNEIILLAVGLIALTFIIVYVLILKIIQPVLKLTDDLREVSRGNLSIRSSISHKDEIGFLSQAFNSMMDNLNQARRELRRTHAHMIQTEKMAAMGKLAAGLAHEINNPLGGVLTCLETLRQDSQDEELRAKYFNLIQTGLERIRKTVKQLLNFGKQRNFQPEPTDINMLMNRTLEMTSHHFSSNRITVQKEFYEDIPKILADPHQLIQVFVNLILNAIQAMPEGGDLWIKTCQEDANVSIIIRDRGCGIPKENLDRIFDPFFSTKEHEQGTGLGLSVSYAIIQDHAGEIEVESEEGFGSQFMILLPINHHKEKTHKSFLRGLQDGER